MVNERKIKRKERSVIAYSLDQYLINYKMFLIKKLFKRKKNEHQKFNS